LRYGLPYKGSKNGIAEWICDNLPNAENFYDLFCGGCAITHCAMLRGKYKTYTINDIADTQELFYDAIMGKYQNETRWISREDFFTLKDKDAYIRYLWSFGNNGKDYLYSREVEPYKKALHYARVFNDFSEFDKMGIELKDASNKNIIQREKEIKEKYIEWAIKYFKFTDEEIKMYNELEKKGVFDGLVQGSVGTIQLKKRLQSLESLQSLQSLQSLEKFQGSYEDVKIKENSVIYCDIPYKGTNEYIGGFDHERFYQWARSQKELVIISEYSMPDDFICIARIEKSQLLNGNGKGKKVLEGLFIPKEQEKLYIRKQTDLEQLLLDF
jgi:site-specific DNA-adenine methylase